MGCKLLNTKNFMNTILQGFQCVTPEKSDQPNTSQNTLDTSLQANINKAYGCLMKRAKYCPSLKGGRRGHQIHALHSLLSRVMHQQCADLFPRYEMNIGRLWIVIQAPLARRCKDSSVIGNTQHSAHNGIVLLGVHLKSSIHLRHAQLLHTQDRSLKRTAPFVNGNGRYLIHANMKASFQMKSQEIMQVFAVYLAIPEKIRSIIKHLRRNSAGPVGPFPIGAGNERDFFSVREKFLVDILSGQKCVNTL